MQGGKHKADCQRGHQKDLSLGGGPDKRPDIRDKTRHQDHRRKQDMPPGGQAHLSRPGARLCVSRHDAASPAPDPAPLHLQVIQLPVCSVQKSNGSNAHLQKPDRPHDNKQ